MELRPAEAADAARLREIAGESFQTSFSLSPDQIDLIVDGVFGDEPLAERVDADESLVLVAEGAAEEEPGGEAILGFVDVDLGDAATIRWLHVEPGHRGLGVGTALFERVRSEADERDLPVAARVLSEDEEGGEFCEQFGFERTGKAKLAFDDETFFEEVHVEAGGLKSLSNEPSVEVPETIEDDGDELTVDRDDETPGTDGPFFPTYRGDPGGDHYGYFCSNCGSTDTGSDSLGRLECQNCGNKHLADQWDAAYL